MNKISNKQQISFIKNLSFLLASGQTLVVSLETIKKQTFSKNISSLIDEILIDVYNGLSLSESMSKQGKRWPTRVTKIIKMGELSGNLKNNLDYLVFDLKKRQKLKKKILSALFYPFFISISSLALVVMLLVYIFPKIMPIFYALNSELPLSSRFLLWLSYFLSDWGWAVLLVGFILSFLFIYFYKRNINFKKRVASFLLKLPIIKGAIKNYNLVDFCAHLSLLLKSGFVLPEAILVTGQSVNNILYREHFLDLQQSVLQGENMSSYLVKYPKFFPEMFCDLIALSENSGDLSGGLNYLAEYYEEELRDLMKNVTSLIEPTLMILMGLLVALVAISVITPIYQITQNLRF